MPSKNGNGVLVHATQIGLVHARAADVYSVVVDSKYMYKQTMSMGVGVGVGVGV